MSPSSGFVPHLTLLYDTQPLAEGPVPPVTWIARDFVLIYSTPGQPYRFLGRWPTA